MSRHPGALSCRTACGLLYKWTMTAAILELSMRSPRPRRMGASVGARAPNSWVMYAVFRVESRDAQAPRCRFMLAVPCHRVAPDLEYRDPTAGTT
eukprot:scaffold3964_cov126-Isochrysis_galbana.AAC.12